MERGRSAPARAGISYGIAGAVLGFCTFASVTLSRLLGGAFGFVAAFGCIAAVGALALLVWAGVAPARASGRATSGAGAGAVAGACTGAGVLLGMLVDGTQNGTIPPPKGFTDALGYVVGVLIILVGAAALFACLGAGLGALGGLLGRGQAAPPDAPPTYTPVGASPYGRGSPPNAGDDRYPPHPA
jgi:hypothetical protein